MFFTINRKKLNAFLSASIIIKLINVQLTHGSVGDRLQFFAVCINDCIKANCSNNEALEVFLQQQPFYMQIMRWECDEECKHLCQWNTIEHIINSGIPYHHVPQFYGKWTFIRLFGIQEPASAIFSLFNLFTNFYAWKKYQKRTRFVPDSYAHLWNLQALLAINAWFWSAVFHTHDTPLTEELDYFSAYSMVIFSLCSLTIRLFADHFLAVNKIMVQLGISMPFIAFYIYHIHYLHYIHFDYGYNMKVNLTTGILSSFGWLFWCYKNRFKGNHIWKCVMSILLVNVLLLLEIKDFPPVAFIFDAHSLWHFGTIPIPLLWFSFLTDEALLSPKYAPFCDIKKNN